MSTRKIRNSWWVDFRFRRVRYRIRSTENSKAGAAAYEVVLRQRLSCGEPIDGRQKDQISIPPTFKEFSEQWHSTYVCNNNKISEQKSKYFTLNAHLIPFFGQKRIDQISSLIIEEYKAKKRGSGLAPKTINNHLSVLSKCLHTAQEWVGLTGIPKIKLLKVPPQPFDFLSRDESEKLLDAINHPVWHAMVLVALRTGLRLGELLALEWPDIDMEMRMLTVKHSISRGVIGTPKSNKERYIPLTKETCDVLKQIKKPRGFVFCQTVGYLLANGKPGQLYTGFVRNPV